MVRRSTLGEISFVDLGADGATSAAIAASAETSEGDDEVPDNNDDQQTTGTPAASANGTAMAASLVDDIRTQEATETERIESVRRICDGRHPEIEAKAIRSGWNAQRAELEVLRATRPSAPAVHVPDSTVTGSVLEAACLLTAGLSEPEKQFQPQTLDVAARRFRGGIGLQELLLEAAWANGYTGRNFRDSRSVLRFAFGHDVQAAFSTVDVSGILSNVANKFLLDVFSESNARGETSARSATSATLRLSPATGWSGRTSTSSSHRVENPSTARLAKSSTRTRPTRTVSCSVSTAGTSSMMTLVRLRPCRESSVGVRA